MTAGAIALGSVLGVVCAQRTSMRARTVTSLLVALMATCAATALVAGTTGAITVAIVAPLGYILRRLFDA